MNHIIHRYRISVLLSPNLHILEHLFQLLPLHSYEHLRLANHSNSLFYSYHLTIYRKTILVVFHNSHLFPQHYFPQLLNIYPNFYFLFLHKTQYQHLFLTYIKINLFSINSSRTIIYRKICTKITYAKRFRRYRKGSIAIFCNYSFNII